MNSDFDLSELGPSVSAGESLRERIVSVEQGNGPILSGWGRLRSVLYRKRGRIEGRALIEALHGVASASASGLDIEDALMVVVEQAKRVTDTDKAILCLLDSSTDHLSVDAETVVARGAREQHPESWWSAHVEEMAGDALSAGTVVIKRDRTKRAWIACAPAPSDSGAVGILCAINSGRAFTHDEINFLGILGAFAATAIENARLAEQARYALLASERDRISREMHDGLAQSLFSASLGLEVCQKRLARDPAEVRDRLSDVQKVITDSMSELRHYIYDLRSPRLDRLGLTEAVRAYMDDVTKGTDRTAELAVKGEARSLADPVETCLYRVAREAITNAIRHSRCRRVRVVIEFGVDEVILTVRDDGDGFDVQRAFAAAGRRGSLGLHNIRDRARALGGDAEVASSDDGGTYVRARVPA